MGMQQKEDTAMSLYEQQLKRKERVRKRRDRVLYEQEEYIKERQVKKPRHNRIRVRHALYGDYE